MPLTLWVFELGIWRLQKALSWGPVPLLTILCLQTKEALHKILGDLRPGDHFDLVLFGSAVQSWKGSLVQASSANLEAARNFVKQFSLAGGRGRGLGPP